MIYNTKLSLLLITLSIMSGANLHSMQSVLRALVTRARPAQQFARMASDKTAIDDQTLQELVKKIDCPRFKSLVKHGHLKIVRGITLMRKPVTGFDGVCEASSHDSRKRIEEQSCPCYALENASPVLYDDRWCSEAIDFLEREDVRGRSITPQHRVKTGYSHIRDCPHFCYHSKAERGMCDMPRSSKDLCPCEEIIQTQEDVQTKVTTKIGTL